MSEEMEEQGALRNVHSRPTIAKTGYPIRSDFFSSSRPVSSGSEAILLKRTGRMVLSFLCFGRFTLVYIRAVCISKNSDIYTS